LKVLKANFYNPSQFLKKKMYFLILVFKNEHQKIQIEETLLIVFPFFFFFLLSNGRKKKKKNEQFE